MKAEAEIREMLPQAKEDQSHQKLKEARRVLSSSLRREHSPLLTPWTSEKTSFLFSTTQVGVICYSSCRRLIERELLCPAREWDRQWRLLGSSG